ncbi:MAG TPA: phage tail sheath subtilisin-like domain-containing protein [Aliidongia sp.]|nr:phage tail sheath subtilisin-like domain-containing protein [Aliidongia sp.]
MSVISFNSIPLDIRKPGSHIEFDNSKANSPLPIQVHRILYLGQRLPTGTVKANIPTQITAPGQGAQYFGRGSMLAQMITAGKNANATTEMWAVALDDNPEGTPATGSVLIAGSPSANATAQLYANGTVVQVAVTTGMAAADIAAAFVEEIEANPDLAVTAAIDPTTPAQIDVTAKHKGAAGNDIDLRLTYFTGDTVPAGLTITITPMAGGEGNPSLTPAIAALGSTWYHSWGNPYTDPSNVQILTAELIRRGGPMVQQQARSYSVVNGSVGTLAAYGQAQNSQWTTFMGAQRLPIPTWVAASIITAIVAFNAPLDPARPLSSLALPGFMAPAKPDLFVDEDQELLLHDGISTFDVGDDGTVTIDRLITTFQLDPQGLPDTSYLSVETVLTLNFLSFWLRSRIATSWPRFKLADDGNSFPVGVNVTTPKLIAADLVAGSQLLFNAGIIQNLADFQKNLIVQRNASDPDRVDAVLPWSIVGQFLVFAGQIQFSF